jgi:hypothetical protein
MAVTVVTAVTAVTVAGGVSAGKEVEEEEGPAGKGKGDPAARVAGVAVAVPGITVARGAARAVAGATSAATSARR